MATPLREVEVTIENLFLDPNNPRFADLRDKLQGVPSDRIVEPGVQLHALERILDERFEVKQLKDSIRSIGFLTIDRLVVTPLPYDGKFLVIEGNRRLGAVKALLEEQTNGEVNLSPDVLASLEKIPVLVLEERDPAKREHLARVLQGVRHVSGIRAWGPYQQAQLVASMTEDGREQAEICEILGLQKKRINILRRCYYALEQMRADDDYSDQVKPNLFSSFDEIFKVPKIRDWLEWDDERNVFLNEERRKQLYSWLVGSEDDNGQRQPAKIVDPKEIRKFPELMADVLQFKRFCESPTLGLEEALAGSIAPKPAIPWRTYLVQNFNTLNIVPATDLEDATTADEDLLKSIRDLCIKHLRLLKALMDLDRGMKRGVSRTH